MKFLKGLLSVIVGLVALLVIGSFFLPTEQHVERSVVIAAEPAEIFPLVNEFREFNKWSPWADIDPEGTTYDFGGPPAGVGATMAWSSEHPNVGSGRQEIVASEPARMVRSRLTFDGFDQPSYATFDLEPAAGGTRVTWSFDANLDGFIGPYMGLMMDKWVGGDYEKGLTRLKDLAES